MTSRPSLGPASGVIPGTTFFSEYKQAMKALFDAANFPLSAVSGTGDVVSAVLQWDLDVAGLLDGMKFTITWGSTNTGPVTLSLNGGPAAPVLTSSGSVLSAGSLVVGTRSLIEYVGGSFLVLSSSQDSSLNSAPYFSLLIASQTWVKPLGYPDLQEVTIEVWGGGAGGGSSTNSGGGGGGGYSVRTMNYIDVPSSVVVTIGAGGAVDTNGGVTSFGTLLYGYAGGRSYPGSGSDYFGGGAGGTLSSGGVGGVAGDGNTNLLGGGGGGGVSSFVATPGHHSYWGGGGGASRGASGGPGLPGRSVHGGDGGASGSPGAAPSGGGGSQAAGARGQVRIRI